MSTDAVAGENSRIVQVNLDGYPIEILGPRHPFFWGPKGPLTEIKVKDQWKQLFGRATTLLSNFRAIATQEKKNQCSIVAGPVVNEAYDSQTAMRRGKTPICFTVPIQLKKIVMALFFLKHWRTLLDQWERETSLKDEREEMEATIAELIPSWLEELHGAFHREIKPRATKRKKAAVAEPPADEEESVAPPREEAEEESEREPETPPEKPKARPKKKAKPAKKD